MSGLVTSAYGCTAQLTSPGTNTNDTMVCYHVYSSTNLVDWTDYGIALHLNNVRWAASHMSCPMFPAPRNLHPGILCEGKVEWIVQDRPGNEHEA